MVGDNYGFTITLMVPNFVQTLWNLSIEEAVRVMRGPAEIVSIKAVRPLVPDDFRDFGRRADLAVLGFFSADARREGQLVEGKLS